MKSTRLILPALTLAIAAALATTAAHAARSGPLAKPPSGGCTAAPSRIAYNVTINGLADLFAVNPDGTCRTQLTTGGNANNVLAWTADKHILVRRFTNNEYRLLSVPNSTSASTVSTVFSWSQAAVDVGDISQHRNASGILPVSQQLYVAIENNNVALYNGDRSVRTQLTNYVSTYTPGGTGTEYTLSRPRWLPDSADLSRIRLVFRYVRVDYVDGVAQSSDEGLRVISMSTSTWPAISTGSLNEDWVGGRNDVIGGYPLSVYANIDFSRDGTKSATRAPLGSGIYVMPVITNDVADTVAIDTANAVYAAGGAVKSQILSPTSFSPNNSQMAYQASHYVGKGGSQTLVQSVFVIGSGSSAGEVEVDGYATNWACCPLWGPNGG